MRELEEYRPLRNPADAGGGLPDHQDRAEQEDSEESVRMENRLVVDAPISDELKADVDEAYRKANAIDAEIKKRAEPLIREIYAKLGKELGKEEAWDGWRKTHAEADLKSRDAVDAWIKEVYEGKFGRGELVVVSKYGEVARLARVVPIQNPTARDFILQGSADRSARLVNESIVENVLRAPAEGTLFKQNSERAYDTSFGLEGDQSRSYSNVEN